MGFPERLAELLSRRGIKPYRLSKEIGVSEGLISNWRSGKRRPAMNNIIKLAEYFEVSADYLLDINLPPVDPLRDQVKQSLLTLSDDAVLKVLEYIRILQTQENQKKYPG